MIQSVSPFANQRLSLGLSLADVQSRLAGHGFNYSVELLQAMERGERRFPLNNPGFVLALANSLHMPVMDVHRAARHGGQTLQANQMFHNKIKALRPQNRFLLRLILRHPILTEIPGFDMLFALVKSIALQLPDHWFDDRA